MVPYVPGEQPQNKDILKLNTNENPYPPSPRVLEALRNTQEKSLQRYPDPDSRDLCAAIAKLHGVSRDSVFVGNGSDEVLAFAFRGLMSDAAPVLFPDLSYSFYPVYCKLFDLDFTTIPVNASFEVPLEAFHRPNGGIVLTNPNAPTGIALPRSAIEALLHANQDSLVLVDEAYVDFGGQSAIPLVEMFPNLLVVQTFSKSRALAGLRLGFAIGDPQLIDGLARVKNSFNSYPVADCAAKAAIASIEDDAWFEAKRHAVMATRARFIADLNQLGMHTLPSATNFVLTCHPTVAATDIAERLRDANILVRHFSAPRICDFVRITIGLDHDMDRTIDALRAILSA